MQRRRQSLSPLSRIFARVVSGDEVRPGLGACDLWTGGTSSRGYGVISIDGNTREVHRLVWEIQCGDVPDKLEVRHRCDVTLCVRLSHLALGTHKQNMNDMVRRGRQRGPRGEVHHRTKLSDDQIIGLCKMKREGASRKDVAAFFGVTPNYVSHLVSRTASRTRREGHLVA